jgi:hypothetical protein
MLDMPDRLVDQIRDVRVVQRVDDCPAASLTDHEAEMSQQPQLVRHGGAFHPDGRCEVVDIAGALAQPRQNPDPARRGQRLHRLRHLTSDPRRD